jgi:hypothetical protein
VRGSRFLLIILSILAMPLLLFALYSIYNYLAFPEAELRHEQLYIVAFMLIYGLFLFVPYIITLVVKWRVHSNMLKLATALPFLALFCCGVFAELNGAPW